MNEWIEGTTWTHGAAHRTVHATTHRTNERVREGRGSTMRVELLGIAHQTRERVTTVYMEAREGRLDGVSQTYASPTTDVEDMC